MALHGGVWDWQQIGITMGEHPPGETPKHIVTESRSHWETHPNQVEAGSFSVLLMEIDRSPQVSPR